MSVRVGDSPSRLLHRVKLFGLAALLCASSRSEGQSVLQQRRVDATGEMSAETIFRRYADRILFLTCDESRDEMALASGVLVSAEDGFVVTNAHVVEGCGNMAATLIRGKSRQSYVPVLKYYSEQEDVAVIKIVGHGFDFFRIPTHPAQIGERVYAIGNPRGLEQTISEGIVSGNREFDGTFWVQHSASISPGSSGGALISSRGELVGINAYLLKESQNLNFAVPAATLAKALQRGRLMTGAVKFPQNGDAEFSKGLLYYRGQGVTQDYSEAAKLFREAADKGHAEAEATLGAIYQLGRGVPQDYAQAAAWYRKAAEQGLPFAQNALGTILSEGSGIPRDDTEAAKWFRRAAEQGDASAQLNLGAAYQLGTGVPVDYVESYYWYRVAFAGRANGASPEQLKALLNAVATHLTPEVLSQTQERAQEWISGHPAN